MVKSKFYGVEIPKSVNNNSVFKVIFICWSIRLLIEPFVSFGDGEISCTTDARFLL